jgi:hypothetical protein
MAPAIGTDAPHLGQNRVPASRVVPQELQKAMGHLVSIFHARSFPRAEYIANSAEVQCRLALTQVTAAVIRHAEREQQKKPKNRSDNHYLRQSFTGVLYVHEKENHEQSFNSSDHQSDYRIKPAEVNEGDGCSNHGQT